MPTHRADRRGSRPGRPSGGRRAQRRARLGRRARGGVMALAMATTMVVGAAALALGPREVVEASERPAGDGLGALAVGSKVHADASAALRDAPSPEPAAPVVADPTALPAGSGEGRRVVFDREAQRVWLVGGAGKVQRTYRVSGSVHDNLDAGRYRVYSRSRHAQAFDFSSTMGYFVRFTRGDNAAIGFHDLPLDRRGVRVQTPEQLGTPLSAGCIRQRRSDARALWDFAPVGTRVVVL